MTEFETIAGLKEAINRGDIDERNLHIFLDCDDVHIRHGLAEIKIKKVLNMTEGAYMMLFPEAFVSRV